MKLPRRIPNFINAFQPADGPPPRTLLAFFRWALAGSWPVLAVATLFSVTVGTLEVLTAIILGRVIDTTVKTDVATYFSEHGVLLAGFVAFFLLLRPIAFGISTMLQSVVIWPNATVLVQSRLHRWTIGQSVSFFDNDFAGRIAQKQMQTSRAIADVAVESINVVAYALATLLGTIALLAAIDARIAAVLVVWCVLYAFVFRWFMPRVRALSGNRAEARAFMSGQIVDTITNIKTVKLFANARHEDRAALKAMQGFRVAELSFKKLAALFRISLMALAGLLPVLLIGGALLLWSHGFATTGDIAAAGAISIRIAHMTGWVSFSLMGIYSNIGEVENGMKTLSPPHEVTDRVGAVPIQVAEGKVQFDNLTFTYGSEKNGVSKINLTLQPNEKVGLVGASGAGKSTLVALLLRLYDPESGRVLIDDQDLQDVTQESFRREIGMVTQETAMFNRSARENILYGRPSASHDELIRAAEKAEAHEFISDLEDFKGRKGYDAHLGERGVKLSGGQRQRIALARAILKDAPILVLDEATSALDSEVEASIQSALETVMTGKTVLAIAHRLSTLARMDRIIVMDEGRIVEEGTHHELLAADGLYARYWKRQSGGFIGIDNATARQDAAE